ncbi:hypothetical protein GCM10023086_20650 [Streptomyces venetus]|uniref:Uncharacterized protein n=1 Tax=Streptomyces venetus TaxID=1701086 RepID=A0ABP8FHZ6_9ACTN
MTQPTCPAAVRVRRGLRNAAAAVVEATVVDPGFHQQLLELLPVLPRVKWAAVRAGGVKIKPPPLHALVALVGRAVRGTRLEPVELRAARVRVLAAVPPREALELPFGAEQLVVEVDVRLPTPTHHRMKVGRLAAASRTCTTESDSRSVARETRLPHPPTDAYAEFGLLGEEVAGSYDHAGSVAERSA